MLDSAFGLLFAFGSGALLLVFLYEWRWRRPPIDQLAIYQERLTRLRNDVADLRSRLRVAATRLAEESRAHAVTREQAHAREMQLLSSLEAISSRESIGKGQDAGSDPVKDLLAQARRDLADREAALRKAQSELAQLRKVLAGRKDDADASQPVDGDPNGAGQADRIMSGPLSSVRDGQSSRVQMLQTELSEARAEADALRREMADLTAFAGQFPILELEKQQLGEALAESEAERILQEKRLSEAADLIRDLKRKYTYVLDRLRRNLGTDDPSSDPAAHHDEVATGPIQNPEEGRGAATGTQSAGDHALAMPVADPPSVIRPDGSTHADRGSRHNGGTDTNSGAPETPANFRQIHGIGPTYEKRLVAAGVDTFAKLAGLTTTQLQEITRVRRFQQEMLTAWLSEAARLAGEPPHPEA